MKKNNVLKLTTIMAAAVLMMTACSSPSTTKTTETTAAEAAQAAETTAAVESGEALTVEIKDVHGLVTVPVNPQKVISLDNRTFETLSDWGIKLVAAPKGVMPAGSPYVADESVLDIGNHREPNLEIIAAADPDLVIVGQRFASYYEEIKKISAKCSSY